MNIEVEDLRVLADIGFIAWSSGQAASADKIFQAVRLARPGAEAGYIGGALVELSRGKPDVAAALLRKAPPSDAARVFLGLALMRFGERADGEEMMREVAASSADEAVARLAREMLSSPAQF